MHLLLIEDYRPLRQSLTKGLHEAGFAVDATGDGKEGLWYATGNEYDVIILDLMLPGMDGLEILKRVRDQGRKASVLILTAKDTVQDRVTGLDLGADDYLVKPFAFAELLARIRALLRRSYQEKSPSVEIADLRIDLTTQKSLARLGGNPAHAPRVCSSRISGHARGQTVSRTDIWEHVYEFNSSASSNVVDVYVGYLRKKLGERDKPVLIHTVRGRGYVLGAKS